VCETNAEHSNYVCVDAWVCHALTNGDRASFEPKRFSAVIADLAERFSLIAIYENDSFWRPVIGGNPHALIKWIRAELIEVVAKRWGL